MLLEKRRILIALGLIALQACSDSIANSSSAASGGAGGTGGASGLKLRVVTFNTGVPQLPGEQGPISDEWYGNGLDALVPEFARA